MRFEERVETEAFEGVEKLGLGTGGTETDHGSFLTDGAIEGMDGVGRLEVDGADRLVWRGYISALGRRREP